MTRDDDDDFARKHARRDNVRTSHEAAQKAEKSASANKAIVLRALREHGPMTSEEISDVTGLVHWECTRRVPDLRHAGLVEDTGEVRLNRSGRKAVVWRAVPQGKASKVTDEPKQKGLFDE